MQAREARRRRRNPAVVPSANVHVAQPVAVDVADDVVVADNGVVDVDLDGESGQLRCENTAFSVRRGSSTS